MGLEWDWGGAGRGGVGHTHCISRYLRYCLKHNVVHSGCYAAHTLGIV